MFYFYLSFFLCVCVLSKLELLKKWPRRRHDNIAEKNIPNIVLSMTDLRILLLIDFLKSKLHEIVNFLQNPYNFHNNAVLHFRTYHKFKFLTGFRNKYGLVNIPEFGSNQQFKPKHIFIVFKYHNFWWMIKLVFLECF